MIIESCHPIDEFAKLVEVVYVDRAGYMGVPGANVSTHGSVWSVLDKLREDVGSVVEVDVGIDQPLVFENVHFSSRDSMPLNPVAGVLFSEAWLGRYDDDMVSVADKGSDRFDRTRERVEVPEDGVAVEIG